MTKQAIIKNMNVDEYSLVKSADFDLSDFGLILQVFTKKSLADRVRGAHKCRRAIHLASYRASHLFKLGGKRGAVQESPTPKNAKMGGIERSHRDV